MLPDHAKKTTDLVNLGDHWTKKRNATQYISISYTMPLQYNIYLNGKIRQI